jgi:hypothetical protein
MFGFFKRDELKLLEKKYVLILEKAMHAQRNGKIEEFSEISFQAEKMLKEIESLKELRKKEK